MVSEVIVYAYTKGAFHFTVLILAITNTNPSGSQLGCRFLCPCMSLRFILGLSLAQMPPPNDCRQKRDGLVSQALSLPILVSVRSLQEQLMSMPLAHHWPRRSDLHSPDYWITMFFSKKKTGVSIMLLPDQSLI